MITLRPAVQAVAFDATFAYMTPEPSAGRRHRLRSLIMPRGRMTWFSSVTAKSIYGYYLAALSRLPRVK
jgi:hypothetical protein